MKKLINMLNKFFYFLFNAFVRFYQVVISPLIPARCRYYPTCSEYGRQALAWHGPWRGSKLAINRVCRCHPWGGHGIDFVPIPLYRYQFHHIDPATFATPSCHYWVYQQKGGYSAQLNDWLRDSIAKQQELLC